MHDELTQTELNERFHAAVAASDGNAVSVLLARGADINAERRAGTEWAGCTPLEIAAHRGDEALLHLILAAGADVGLQDHLPLGFAAGEGHVAVCRLLLEHGAEVNRKVGPGFMALMSAVEAHSVPLVQMLLEAGADPNAPRAWRGGGGMEPGFGKEWEYTCLMVAAGNIDADICRLLVEHRADVNAHGPVGFTPLDIAAGFGSAVICELLLENGANPNARDEVGATPLIIAAGTGSSDVCSLLLAHGADPRAFDATGRTALATAAAQGHADTVALLIAAGEGAVTQDRVHGCDARCVRCRGHLQGDSAFCAACGYPAAGFPSSNRAAPSSLHVADGRDHANYSRVFAQFDAAGGKWVPTFNLLAFFIGPIWYLFNGMWPKALGIGLASFLLISITGGVGVFIPWLYYGFFANWDLYLFKREGKQGW